MAKMTNFDFKFDQSSADAVLDRLDFYISTDGGLKWLYLGIFDDEGSFETTKELFEYDNNGKPFISNYTKEKFQIKGSLLNTSNIYARALAFGRDPADVDVTTMVRDLDTVDCYSLDMSELRAVPPYFALRAIGKNQSGKHFAHEFARAQVTTASITETLNNKDIVKLPIEITAFEDPEAKLGFTVYRYLVDK